MDTPTQIYTDIFTYNDGELFNKVQRANSEPAGKKAGYFDGSSGYFKVKIKGKSVLLHRVIYEMFHGECPKYLDHIDRDKKNNRIENLRPCTKTQNTVNSCVRSDNPYGCKGVTFHKASGKFAAQTMYEGKRVHIGLFHTVEEASQAYNKKARELFGEFAVLNLYKGDSS